jgi:hypothetical protein
VIHRFGSSPSRITRESMLRSYAFAQPALAACFQSIFTHSDDAI